MYFTKYIYLNKIFHSRKSFPPLVNSRWFYPLVKHETATLQVLGGRQWAVLAALDLKLGASLHPTRKKGFSLPTQLSPAGWTLVAPHVSLAAALPGCVVSAGEYVADETMSALGLSLGGFGHSKSLDKNPMPISPLNLNSINPKELHHSEWNIKFLLNFGFAFFLFFGKKTQPKP